MRQAVGDDRLHARLAEGAARLLVGEDRLQLHDLAGQRLDVALRRVDHRQPLLQPGQALMRGLGLLGHRLAEAAGHGVEPLSQRLGELGLPGAEHFCDRAHAPLHLGLRLQDIRHPRLRVTRMIGGLGRRRGARLSRAPQRDDERQEQCQQQHCAETERLTERDRGGAEPRERLRKNGGHVVHAASIADSARWHRSKREQGKAAPVDAFPTTS